MSSFEYNFLVMHLLKLTLSPTPKFKYIECYYCMVYWNSWNTSIHSPYFAIWKKRLTDHKYKRSYWYVSPEEKTGTMPAEVVESVLSEQKSAGDPGVEFSLASEVSDSRGLGCFWPYSLFFFHTEHMEVTILLWNSNFTRFKSCIFRIQGLEIWAILLVRLLVLTLKHLFLYYSFSLIISSIWFFEYCKIKHFLPFS